MENTCTLSFEKCFAPTEGGGEISEQALSQASDSFNVPVA